ncbi:hypothetical protein [Paraburkholderia heleia]|uniref:hypothetical protein n=1 Tax=Paraburkholderia heleia TaxID=634127 RepID=UPI0031D568D8
MLLGDTYRNGGRGTPKKQTRKLGRRNTNDAAANSESSGYALDDQDKLKIACGWESFVTDGRSTRTAYLETMGTFYADRIEIANGTETPILKPDSQRPTQRQFNYWGPRGDPAQSATRRMLGEHEYRVNHRGMPGSASNDVLLIGQRAWTDSSGGDVRLTSVVSRLTEVGIATFTCIVEARTEVIPGVYIGFERPSARTHLLAAAHAALPKAEWCARFGIPDVTEDQIPALRLDEIVADNGEARNGEAIRVSLKAWEGWIEYVRAGDGSAKGSVEGEHHVRHREVDHLLPGTTHSPNLRAQPGSPAILNYYEYVAHHIRRIIYHNSVQPAPHLVTGEMRGELSAVATRMDVFRWLVKHGYINGKPPDAELIRAHMLPSFPASITTHGVFLHRPDRGSKKEYVLACRFVGKYLVESGLLEAARRNGVIPAEISLDPNDLSVAWFRTRDFGLERLENVDRDRWLIQHATLHELLFLQDRDQRELRQNSTKLDQDAFNFLHERDAHSSVAVEQYNIAQERTTASPQGQDAPNSAAARRTETTLLEKSGLADPVGKLTYVPRTTSAPTGDKAPAAQPLPAASAASVTSPSSDIADDVLAAIDKFIKKDF